MLGGAVDGGLAKGEICVYNDGEDRSRSFFNWVCWLTFLNFRGSGYDSIKMILWSLSYIESKSYTRD